MNKEELLFNDIYNQTQDFGRTQFVREIVKLQQKVNQLEEKEELHLNRIDELTDRVVNSKSVLDEIRKIVSKSVFKTDLVELCGMKNEIKEILNKVGGSNE